MATKDDDKDALSIAIGTRTFNQGGKSYAVVSWIPWVVLGGFLMFLVGAYYNFKNDLHNLQTWKTDTVDKLLGQHGQSLIDLQRSIDAQGRLIDAVQIHREDDVKTELRDRRDIDSLGDRTTKVETRLGARDELAPDGGWQHGGSRH